MNARACTLALAVSMALALPARAQHAGHAPPAVPASPAPPPSLPATTDPHAGMDMPETEPASDGHDHQH